MDKPYAEGASEEGSYVTTLSQDEVIILASIIEKEAANSPTTSRAVSAVLHNRLNAWAWRLESDSDRRPTSPASTRLIVPDGRGAVRSRIGLQHLLRRGRPARRPHLQPVPGRARRRPCNPDLSLPRRRATSTSAPTEPDVRRAGACSRTLEEHRGRTSPSTARSGRLTTSSARSRAHSDGKNVRENPSVAFLRQLPFQESLDNTAQENPSN